MTTRESVCVVVGAAMQATGSLLLWMRSRRLGEAIRRHYRRTPFADRSAEDFVLYNAAGLVLPVGDGPTVEELNAKADGIVEELAAMPPDARGEYLCELRHRDRLLFGIVIRKRHARRGRTEEPQDWEG